MDAFRILIRMFRMRITGSDLHYKSLQRIFSHKWSGALQDKPVIYRDSSPSLRIGQRVICPHGSHRNLLHTIGIYHYLLKIDGKHLASYKSHVRKVIILRHAIIHIGRGSGHCRLQVVRSFYIDTVYLYKVMVIPLQWNTFLIVGKVCTDKKPVERGLSHSFIACFHYYGDRGIGSTSHCCRVSIKHRVGINSIRHPCCSLRIRTTVCRRQDSAGLLSVT